MTNPDPTTVPKPDLKPTLTGMYFIKILHLMYNKPNLLKMRQSSTFEEAFQQKAAEIIPGNPTRDDISVNFMISKLKVLFAQKQEGGGMNLETLKRTLRDKVSQIKPRSS
jgi:hypothetical protein